MSKGILHTKWHDAEGVLKRVGVHLSLLLLRELAGHQLGGGTSKFLVHH